MKKLEVCCADIESVWAAKEGGAHRIELCEALELDGLTPSEELIRQAIATGMPVQVLIRVREGNFVYSPEEVETMAASIRLAKELGAHGVVLGALTPGGQIDKPAIARMMEEAEGMSVTFISSELDEMLRTCSRLVVMRDRKVVGELSGEDLTQSKVMGTIAGGEK